MSMKGFMDQFFKAGRLGAAHGVRGQIKVQSFLQTPGRLQEEDHVYFVQSIARRFPQLFQDQNLKVQGVDADSGEKLDLFGLSFKKLALSKTQATAEVYIGTLDSVHNKDQIAGLTNLEFYLPLSGLPQLEDDEFYWRDLIGLEVLDLDGNRQGVIGDMLETGANDVVVVFKDQKPESTITEEKKPSPQTQKQRVLVPYIPERVIKSIDLEKSTMTIDWDFSDDDAE